MKGRAIGYSDEELAWIEAHKTMPRRELHAAFVKSFGRNDVSQRNLTALCKRRGWHTGRTGRFTKGMTPHNKGAKGWCTPGSEKGWFRKGKRRGAAIDLYKPIGAERISKSGYIERKVNDGMPTQSRWRAVHRINWEAINGPVPEGHCLKCIDGDKTNTDPSNWVAIPRALLPRLSGRWAPMAYDDAPDEMKPTLLAIARLEHQAQQAKKEAKKEARK